MSSGSVVSPFRIALILATSAQMGTYFVVISYSLVFGTIDFAWPLKVAFLTGLGVLVYLTYAGVKRTRPVRKVQSELFRELLVVFLIDLGGTAVALYLSFPTLFRTFGGENLSTVTPDVKLFAVVAIALLFVFLASLVSDTVSQIRRKPLQPIPTIGGKQDE